MDKATKERIRAEAYKFAEQFKQFITQLDALTNEQSAPVAMFCRRWGQCRSLAKAEAQPCCGCADYEPDESDAKPGPVELGEFNGIRLSYCHDHECVQATLPDTSFSTWSPGQCADGGLNKSPLMTNALLTAYRRAVAKGLATWPEGWGWARQAMPEGWLAEKRIWLGTVYDCSELCNCGWPNEPFISGYETSRARAAMLGLCEAIPWPEPGCGPRVARPPLGTPAPEKSADRPETTLETCQRQARELRDAREELQRCYDVLGAAPADLPTKITPGCVSDSVHSMLSMQRQQLAAAQANVAKADKLIGQLRDVVKGQDQRISRMCEVSAQAPMHGIHHDATTVISTADNWLARNTPRPA